MKRVVIYILLLLTIPALCQGSVGPDPDLKISQLRSYSRDACELKLELDWLEVTVPVGRLDLTLDDQEGDKMDHFLEEIQGGIRPSDRAVPRDMVSMMSFVWGEMFGGVDIVAEVKEFARLMRRKSRYAILHRNERQDSRSQWQFTVSFRVDEQTEIAASFRNRGELFGEGDVTLEINALDPMSGEIGLKMAYNGGELDIRADRMTLTDTAEAKLMVKF